MRQAPIQAIFAEDRSTTSELLLLGYDAVRFRRSGRLNEMEEGCCERHCHCSIYGF
jgi:hypothetical protein